MTCCFGKMPINCIGRNTFDAPRPAGSPSISMIWSTSKGITDAEQFPVSDLSLAAFSVLPFRKRQRLRCVHKSRRIGDGTVVYPFHASFWHHIQITFGIRHLIVRGCGHKAILKGLNSDNRLYSPLPPSRCRSWTCWGNPYQLLA